MIASRLPFGFHSLAGLVIGTGLLLSPLTTFAQEDLASANPLCESQAENVGLIELPHELTGSLGSEPAENRVDFHRFEAEPGARLDAWLFGNYNGAGDLQDPMLGWFDSDCLFVAVNDDYNSPDSYLQVTVPADGIFILAATRYADYLFDGSEQYAEGSSYTLSLSEAITYSGSISAHLTNSLTGTALSGYNEPYAYVDLYRCDIDCDEYVDSRSADDNGVVRFNAEDSYPGLGSGTYLMRAHANEHGSNESGRFDFDNGNDLDIGIIPLSPPAITLGDVQACDDILPQGGTCHYEVSIDNNTDAPLNALVWSEVEGYSLSSAQGYTRFEASSTGASDDQAVRATVSVPAFSSASAGFSFEVPSFAPEGAQFCQTAMLGLYPNPLFNTADWKYLFCVEKTSIGLRKLVGAEMALISASHNERIMNSSLRSHGLVPPE